MIKKLSEAITCISFKVRLLFIDMILNFMLNFKLHVKMNVKLFTYIFLNYFQKYFTNKEKNESEILFCIGSRILLQEKIKKILKKILTGSATVSGNKGEKKEEKIFHGIVCSFECWQLIKTSLSFFKKDCLLRPSLKCEDVLQEFCKKKWFNILSPSPSVLTSLKCEEFILFFL